MKQLEILIAGRKSKPSLGKILFETRSSLPLRLEVSQFEESEKIEQVKLMRSFLDP